MSLSSRFSFRVFVQYRVYCVTLEFDVLLAIYFYTLLFSSLTGPLSFLLFFLLLFFFFFSFFIMKKDRTRLAAQLEAQLETDFAEIQSLRARLTRAQTDSTTEKSTQDALKAHLMQSTLEIDARYRYVIYIYIHVGSESYV